MVRANFKPDQFLLFSLKYLFKVFLFNAGKKFLFKFEKK